MSEYPAIEIPTGVNVKSVALNNDDTFLILVYEEQGDQALYLGFVDIKIVNEEVETPHNMLFIFLNKLYLICISLL